MAADGDVWPEVESRNKGRTPEVAATNVGLRPAAAATSPEAGGQLARHLGVAGQVLPQAALIHVELATHRARMVGAPSLCWVAGKSIRADLRAGIIKLTGHPGGIGVLVDKLHVFHQQLAGHAQLVADGTTAGVGTPHQGLVLQKNKNINELKFFNGRTQICQNNPPSP